MKHNGTINNFNHNKALALLTIKNLDAHKKILHGQGARNHDVQWQLKAYSKLYWYI